MGCETMWWVGEVQSSYLACGRLGYHGLLLRPLVDHWDQAGLTQNHRRTQPMASPRGLPLHLNQSGTRRGSEAREPRPTRGRINGLWQAERGALALARLGNFWGKSLPKLAHRKLGEAAGLLAGKPTWSQKYGGGKHKLMKIRENHDGNFLSFTMTNRISPKD